MIPDPAEAPCIIGVGRFVCFATRGICLLTVIEFSRRWEGLFKRLLRVHGIRRDGVIGEGIMHFQSAWVFDTTIKCLVLQEPECSV